MYKIIAKDYRPISICDHQIVDLFIKSVCGGKTFIANMIFINNIFSLVGLGDFLFPSGECFTLTV